VPFVGDCAKTVCDVLQTRRKPDQAFALALVDGLLDDGKLLQRGRIGLLEIRNLRIVRLRREIARADPHLTDRFLEIPARLGDRIGAAIALEGVADFKVAAHERRAVGDETRHRNQDQQHDPGAHR
jgi:hypothetical protein